MAPVPSTTYPIKKGKEIFAIDNIAYLETNRIRDYILIAMERRGLINK